MDNQQVLMKKFHNNYYFLDLSATDPEDSLSEDRFIQNQVKHSLRLIAEYLQKRGANINSGFVFLLIKEIVQLTNFEYTAMFAGDAAKLDYYGSDLDKLRNEIQKNSNLTYSQELLLRAELQQRGIIQSAIQSIGSGVSSDSMPIDTYANIFELGLLRLIRDLYDTLYVNFPAFRQEKGWKEGDTVAIPLELMPSQEIDIPYLAVCKTREKGWNGVVLGHTIQTAGKKGFLGMGASPNLYQVSVKLLPRQLLPEAVDPSVTMDGKQINEYLNNYIKNLIWDKEVKFLRNEC